MIVLVGPKGSGRTTIGGILAREPGVRFLEVEAIAKRVLAEPGNVIDERYARRAFDEIVREAEAIDGEHHAVVLETTGAADETARIAGRDPSRQVEVPVARIPEMHERTEALRLAWDPELVNDLPIGAQEIMRLCAALLGATGAAR
ncbi:MAG TPA: hypothetical protein VL049_26565 [Candidatus Dormibacteraeota bacterium]|nr:hypothetical protein [Candidatus Dormibacteraeota bacterium]